MECPYCKKRVTMDSPSAPFCSEKHRLIDLERWLDEEYVISTKKDSLEWKNQSVDRSGEDGTEIIRSPSAETP